LNQVRTVLFIQVLNSFVSGVFGVALPLMMKERNIDVVMMGFVFAAMPLIMQFGRMFFATVSDFWGRKLFFFSNGFVGVVSGMIYYFAHTPLEFLFGKVIEGTKEGTLWAVNRAFLLEKSNGHWRPLVYLRTATYVAYALGSLLAGFLVVWLLFEETMMLCALVGVFVILLSLLLAGWRKERFNMEKALRFLDFRKKDKIFKVFLSLFLVMGLSFGLTEGFVIPLFLDSNGFNAETIGLIIGVQVLLAGVFSYLFSKTTKMREIILLSGVLFSVTFVLLGFSSFVLAGVLVIFYGVVQGLSSIGQEGILSRICEKESYGTDIGLLMMGLHVGEAASLALSGLLVATWGYVAPFLLAASTFVIFTVGSYLVLKE
jgi:MFS family permease